MRDELPPGRTSGNDPKKNSLQKTHKVFVMEIPISDLSNPYVAPEADLSAMNSSARGPTAGTLEQTLAGNTAWTIEEILGDAWRLVSGYKGTIWLALAAYFGLAVVVNILTAIVLRATNSALISQLANFGFTAVILWPVMAGMLMLGVRRAAGAETRFGMLGNYGSQTLRIAGLLILQSLLVFIGFVLLVIPGIYLSIAYILAVPLLVDRDLGIWEALETSRRAIGTCWFRTFGLLLVTGLLLLLVPLTLGIAGIWILPMVSLVFGVLYHRLVGYSGDNPT
jgi:uncharacterized membrane protein